MERINSTNCRLLRTAPGYGDNLGKPDAINPHVRFDERRARDLANIYLKGSGSSTLITRIVEILALSGLSDFGVLLSRILPSLRLR